MKAILLDIVGTILKPKTKSNFIEISEYLQSKGYEVYYQSLEAAYKYVFFIKFMKTQIRSYEEFCKLMFESMEIDVDKETLKHTANLMKKSSQFVLFDDVIDFLKAVKGKYLIALVTTTPKFMFEEFLGKSKKYFNEIITGWEAKASKPNPKIYLTALKKLGVKAEEAIYIGDDINLDIIPPKRLGMKTIYINKEGLNCKEADYSAKNLRECVKYIL